MNSSKKIFTLAIVALFFVALGFHACAKKESPMVDDDFINVDDEPALVFPEVLLVLDTLSLNTYILRATLTEHNQTIVEYGFKFDETKVVIGENLTDIVFESETIDYLENFNEYTFEAFVTVDTEDILSNAITLQPQPLISVTNGRYFPGELRVGQQGFLIEDYYYVGAGVDATGPHPTVMFNDFWRYHVDSDSWQEMSNLPEKVTFHTAFSINNQGYFVVGGMQGPNSGVFYPSKKVFRYDAVSDEWNTMNEFSGTERTFPISFTIGNDAFVGLGKKYSTFLKDLWKYDVNSDSWTQMNDVSTSNINAQYSAIVSNDTHAYLIGLVGDLFKMMIYNPITDTWIQAATFEPIGDHSSQEPTAFFLDENTIGFLAQDRFDIMSMPENGLWVYSIDNDQWSHIAYENLPQFGRFGFKNSFNYEDKIITMLGGGYLNHTPYGAREVYLITYD